MSKARIHHIEAAILQAVRDDAAITRYVPRHQVQTLDRRGVDFASGQIVVAPPAVLVFYLGGTYQARTVTGKSYAAREPFLLLAVAENLRGTGEAKRGAMKSEKGAYELIDDLKTLLAGRKLTVASGVDVYCFLSNVSFEGINPNGHYVYGIEVEARGNWDNVSE